MKKHSSGFYIGIIASIILGFGIVAGVTLALRSDAGVGYQPEVLRADKTGPNSATLDLSTFPDSMICHSDAPNPEIGWVTYCPSTTWELPANSIITVKIQQYDSASGLYNDFFSQVQGTDGGVAMYNGTPMNHINPADAAHTFTIQSEPNEPNPIFVSVPLLGVPDNAPTVTVAGNSYPKPNVITFQFRTGPAGHNYIWHCYVPCGNDRKAPYGFSGPMATLGYMAGTISVTNF